MVRTNDFLKSINLYVKVAQSQKVFHFVFNENQKKKVTDQHYPGALST